MNKADDWNSSRITGNNEENKVIFIPSIPLHFVVDVVVVLSLVIWRKLKYVFKPA